MHSAKPPANKKAFDKSSACGRRNKVAFLIFRHCVLRNFLQIKKAFDKSSACGRRNKVAFLIFRHCVLRNFLQIKKSAEARRFFWASYWYV
jgi:hypothetical protein